MTQLITLPEGFEELKPEMQNRAEAYVRIMNEFHKVEPDRPPQEYTSEALDRAAKELSDETGDAISANQIRTAASRAKVYVSKTVKKAASASSGSSASGGAKMSKAEAINALKEQYTGQGVEVADELDKLTGKLAQFLYNANLQLRPDLNEE